MNKIDDPVFTKLNFFSLIPAYTSIGVMKLVTLSAQFFGDQQMAERLKEHTDAMWASRVGRILCSGSRLLAPLPLLARSVNVPQDSVLFRDEEIPLAMQMQEQLKLNLTGSFRGLKAAGVCLGTSLLFAEAAMNCNSEEELIAAAKLFEEGCPAKGVAIQRLKDRVPYSNSIIRWVLGVDDEQETQTLNALASLVGLQAEASARFSENRDSLLKFCMEPGNEDHYHVIVFVKRDFGSYLFDPIIGLMRASSPAEDLKKLLSLYHNPTPQAFKLESAPARADESSSQ